MNDFGSILAGGPTLAGPLTGQIAAPQGAMTGFTTGSMFDAANYSKRRGYLYIPTLDSRDEIGELTRTELLAKGRWLVRNVGFAKRCIWGLARMAGWLSPIPLTKDKAWNKAAAELFERKYGASTIGFDVQGRQNFYSYQILSNAIRMQDGDFFSVLSESQAGSAMVMSYEANQIADCGPPIPRDSGLRMRDGGIVNELDRILGYRLRGQGAAWTNLDARHVIHHADWLAPNHTRGVSALHTAINHLLDRTELFSHLKSSSKIASDQGFYVTGPAPQARTGAPVGMGAQPTGAPTSATETEWLFRDLYDPDKRGGKIVDLSAGREIKQLLDQRPHPNTIEFLDYLCRDIAVGLDIPYEVLWNIAKIGGASVRYVMGDAQKAIERLQQLLVDQLLTRFWVVFAAKEMAAGRLPKCEDPNWYLVGWQPQAKLTVDVGREGRLSIDLHKAGMLTLNAWFGVQGAAWQDQIEQAVEEYAYKVQVCAEASARFGFEITPEKVWPASNPPPPEAITPDPDLDDVTVEKTTPKAHAA